MMIDGHECYLGEDGTLDTVIVIDGRDHRFNAEYASYYRDGSGAMTEEGFIELATECIADIKEWDEPE